MDDYDMTTTEALIIAMVTRPTVISWCKKYKVNGIPLGKKIGGRWKMNRGRLDDFLRDGGDLEKVNPENCYNRL